MESQQPRELPWLFRQLIHAFETADGVQFPILVTQHPVTAPQFGGDRRTGRDLLGGGEARLHAIKLSVLGLPPFPGLLVQWQDGEQLITSLPEHPGVNFNRTALRLFGGILKQFIARQLLRLNALPVLEQQLVLPSGQFGRHGGDVGRTAQGFGEVEGDGFDTATALTIPTVDAMRDVGDAHATRVAVGQRSVHV